MSALSQAIEARQQYIFWAKRYHRGVMRYRHVTGMEALVASDRRMRALALGAAREFDYLAKAIIHESCNPSLDEALNMGDGSYRP